MKFIVSILFFLFVLNNLRGSANEHLSNKEEDSDIFYNGFINNEGYQHYLPSKYPDSLKDKDYIKIICKKGYTVSVKSAFIIDLNDEEQDYTSMAQTLCENKEQCNINVRNFKRNTNSNTIDQNSELNIEYICLSSEKPLFDGNKFHQGITNDYLVVRDRTLACAQKGVHVFSFPSISKAKEMCDLKNCISIIWNNEENKAIICKDDNSDNLIEKKGNIVYMNPNHFYTDGYAIFLNYMSICDNMIKSIPHNFTLLKSIDICSHLDCKYFTKSYAGSIRSLKNTKNGKSWFCKGFPTIIPMDGFVTSVNINKSI